MRSRLCDPERLEQGKVLSLGLAGVDRQSPRRQSVDLSFGNSPEIARAEKNANLVVIIRPVARSVNPKPRDTPLHPRPWCRGAPEGKVVPTICNPGRLAVRDLVDIHPRRVVESAMEELHFERQFLAAPQRVFGQKTYRAVVIVIHVLQAIRQFGIRRLERFAGRITSALPNNRSIKCGRLRPRGPREPARS